MQRLLITLPPAQLLLGPNKIFKQNLCAGPVLTTGGCSTEECPLADRTLAECCFVAGNLRADFKCFHHLALSNAASLSFCQTKML